MTTQTIVQMEWDLFDQVRNIGGRANCQDSKTAFFTNRTAQLDAWTEELRKSYLQDLRAALMADRDPVSEKYAYMMERTNPAEFAEVAEYLPPRPAEKMAMVDEICAAHVAWLRELSARYPLLTGLGRGIDRSTDTPRSTSMETYLWGELSTYSKQTLGLYLDYVRQLKDKGKNLNEMILQNTVLAAGFSSLKEAEDHLARH